MSEKTATTSGGAPSPMELVQEFHRTYSMPIRSFDEPTLSYDRLDMRMSLIAEEFAELMGAVYGKRARAIIEAATASAVAADDGERDVIEAADALAREPPDGRHRVEAQAAKRRDVGIAELRIAARMRMDAAHARKAHLRAGLDGRQIDRPRIADGNLDDASLAIDVDGDLAPDLLRDSAKLLIQFPRRKLPDRHAQIVEALQFSHDMRFEVLHLALNFFILHDISPITNSAVVIIFSRAIPKMRHRASMSCIHTMPQFEQDTASK